MDEPRHIIRTSPRRPTAVARVRNRKVAGIAAATAGLMLGAAFAAVPLYRLFCQVTGYAGTTQRAASPSTEILDRRMTIRFDANVAPGLAWRFEPVQRTMDVRIGETALATYRATNVSSDILTGTATYNVTPDQAGIFFNKLACFCFTEQTLRPGESVDMPVSFFVDPALATSKDAGQLQQITLSYTFYRVAQPKAAASARPPTTNGG